MDKPHKPKSEPLPKWLVLTPERIAVIKEQQQLLRAEAESRGRLSPQARRLQLGLAHETSARAEVEMLEAELAEKRTSNRKGKSARLHIARARLAEALAHQGRYNEACDYAAGDQRAEYFELWAAVWSDDHETCPCEPAIHEGLALTHDHVSQEVFSVRHNKLLPAIKCNHCGFLNVRPLTHELQQLQKLRQRSLALIHGRTPEDLLHNAHEILASLHDRETLKR